MAKVLRDSPRKRQQNRGQYARLLLVVTVLSGAVLATGLGLCLWRRAPTAQIPALETLDPERLSLELTGADPAVIAAIDAARTARSTRVSGLMLLPPAVDDQNAARPYFRALRELRDRLLARGVDSSMLDELSMGMSHDFEVAIEEGSTIVRVGTAIFGGRTPVGP